MNEVALSEGVGVGVEEVGVDRVVDQETVDVLHRFGTLCFGALRLELMLLLRKGELCVSEMANRLELDVSQISHALRDLREAELVSYRASHRSRVYRLTHRVQIHGHDGPLCLVFSNGDGVELAVRIPG